MGRMTETYKFAKQSNRLPLIIFILILNIGALNAQFKYQENNKTKKVLVFNYFFKYQQNNL